MVKTEYQAIKERIADEVVAASNRSGYNVTKEEAAASISFAEKYSDISSTIAMKLAKAHSKASSDIGNEIIRNTKAISSVERVSFENGFINFHLERNIFFSGVLDEVTKRGWADEKGAKRAKVIAEYPSINPAHPLHIGHVRSALLGDSISNILETTGYEVEREDYIDDLGLQAAEALWGVMNMERIGITFNPSKKYDHMLGEIYVTVNQKIKADQSVMDEIKKTSELMEQSGTYESKLLQDMVESFLKAEYDTLFKMGIFHNVMVWESAILANKLLEKAIENLDKEHITERPKEGKYAGCIIIDIKKLKGAPESMTGLQETTKVLVRSNGTPGYFSKDLAFHMWKFGLIRTQMRFKKFIEQPNGSPVYSTAKDGEPMEFGGAETAINPIDSRQSYEQDLVGLIIGNMAKKARFVHIPYGTVDLEGGVLSGRKGSWIGFTADDLISEAVAKARELVSPRDEISEKERERIADAVAMAAIRFEFLKISYEKKIVFSWERALNFEGNSGPYCQYMYTRANRIVASVKEAPIIAENYKISDTEFDLIKKIAAYWEQVSKASEEMKPHILAAYLNELCALFGKFYEAKQVSKADTAEERRARLGIVIAFREVAGLIMDILGIKRLEAM